MQLEMPTIDYESHPAFAGVHTSYDTVAELLIEEIGVGYARLLSETSANDQLIAAFDRDIAPRLDALTDRLVAAARPQFRDYLTRAFAVARRVMRDDLNARDHDGRLKNSGAQGLKGHFVANLSSFREKGCYKFEQPRLAKLIRTFTLLERAMLRLRKKQIPGRHCVVSLHLHSPAGWLIRIAMEKSGAMDFAAAYLGKPVEFYYAALDHAHPEQDWYQDCYRDIQLGTSKTAYMHTDADCDIIKAMVYLYDVHEKDGPFCFISGSQQWKRSHLTVAVQKGFDEASYDAFAGHADNGNYYRPRFRHVENRRDMLTLPPQLRGSTHFGDDVLDGSELSEALLHAETRFVASAGTIVMFDGSRGIHRGGLAKTDGTRWAIQLAFRARRTAPLSDWQKFLRDLRGVLSYCKYAITRSAGLMCGRFIS